MTQTSVTDDLSDNDEIASGYKNYEYQSNKALSEKLLELENYYSTILYSECPAENRAKVKLEWERFYFILFKRLGSEHWLKVGELQRLREKNGVNPDSIWLNGYFIVSVIGVLLTLVAIDFHRIPALVALVFFVILSLASFGALGHWNTEDRIANLTKKISTLERDIFEMELTKYGFLQDYELSMLQKYYSFLPDPSEENERRGLIFLLMLMSIKIGALRNYSSSEYFSSLDFLRKKRIKWEELGIDRI
jgi:hypothetical protein